MPEIPLIIGFTIIVSLLLWDISLRWKHVKLLQLNDNSLDIDYPVKVLSPSGYPWLCCGLGKVGVIVKRDVWSNEKEIPIETFKSKWTYPKSMRTIIDKMSLEEQAAKLYREAAEELNTTVGL